MKRPKRNKSKLWEVADLYRQLIALTELLIELLLDELHSPGGKIVPLKRPKKPGPRT